MTINYGVDRVRFPAPVPSASRIRARFRVDEVTEVAAGQLRIAATIEREGGGDKPVCVAVLLVRSFISWSLQTWPGGRGLLPWPAGGGRPKGRAMRISRVFAVLAVVAAIAVPVALALRLRRRQCRRPGPWASPTAITFVADSGCPPYEYVVQSGVLPPGLSLSLERFPITGTPTTAGSFALLGRACGDKGCCGALQSRAARLRSGRSRS